MRCYLDRHLIPMTATFGIAQAKLTIKIHALEDKLLTCRHWDERMACQPGTESHCLRVREV